MDAGCLVWAPPAWLTAVATGLTALVGSARTRRCAARARALRSNPNDGDAVPCRCYPVVAGWCPAHCGTLGPSEGAIVGPRMALTRMALARMALTRMRKGEGGRSWKGTRERGEEEEKKRKRSHCSIRVGQRKNSFPSAGIRFGGSAARGAWRGRGVRKRRREKLKAFLPPPPGMGGRRGTQREVRGERNIESVGLRERGRQKQRRRSR